VQQVHQRLSIRIVVRRTKVANDIVEYRAVWGFATRVSPLLKLPEGDRAGSRTGGAGDSLWWVSSRVEATTWPLDEVLAAAKRG
jgi:hypothetical protein